MLIEQAGPTKFSGEFERSMLDSQRPWVVRSSRPKTAIPIVLTYTYLDFTGYKIRTSIILVDPSLASGNSGARLKRLEPQKLHPEDSIM